QGHGLGRSGELTEAERQAYLEAFGRMPLQGSRFPVKTEVRITVCDLSSSSLVRWSRWGPKNCEPGWYDRLCVTDGHQHRTWWVYFDLIPPSLFTAVETQKAGVWESASPVPHSCQ